MSEKYSIDQNTKTLVFTDKPKSLIVKKKDRLSFVSVVVPNSVSSIDERAFEHCRSLASIRIPNSVSAIADRAFRECASLTSIHIPNSINSIGYATFFCSALASIHIPNSLKAIEGSSFGNCSALAFIHIPNSVTSIEWRAFAYCRSLASIHIPNSVSSVDVGAFRDCRLHKAYVPINSRIKAGSFDHVFQPQTAILRPRLNPIFALQKKSACRTLKTGYPIYL